MRPFVACLLLWGACFTLGPAAAGEAKPPVKLGATLALSGKLAYMGQRELEGMQLAVEEINRSGGIAGRPLLLLVEDNQGEAKLAASGVSKLLVIDRADIILSAFTHITLAIKEMVKRSGKVMVYEAGLRTIAEEHPFFFRDYYDARDAGEALIDAVKRRGLERIGFIAEMNDSCLEFERGAGGRAAAYGIHFTKKEFYNAGETDFRPLLMRLKASGARALVTCTWRDTPLLMKNLRELAMLSTPTFQFVGHNPPEADTPEMRKLFEENRAVSSSYGFIEGDPNPVQKRFIASFTARFGHAPRPDSAFAYDDINVLAAALAPCLADALDQRCVTEHLSAAKHEGVAGRLSFNSQRVSSRPVLLLRVKNGVWVADD